MRYKDKTLEIDRYKEVYTLFLNKLELPDNDRVFIMFLKELVFLSSQFQSEKEHFKLFEFLDILYYGDSKDYLIYMRFWLCIERPGPYVYNLFEINSNKQPKIIHNLDSLKQLEDKLNELETRNI